MHHNILIAAWGGPGHLGPMLTAARQLCEHGHSVRFLSRADAHREVETAGFGFSTWHREPKISPISTCRSGLQYACDHLLFGPAAARAADMREEIERVPTEALLGDSALFGSAVAAEAAGIPYALLSPTISLRPLPGVPPITSRLTAPVTTRDRVRVAEATKQYIALMNRWLPMLNEARASQDLAPVDSILEIFDRADRFLIAMSAAFDFAADYLPENVRFIGPLLDRSAWAKPWNSSWLTGPRVEPSRLRVLVSFSTTNQNQADALQRTARAVAQAGLEGVATLGPEVNAAALRAPPNVTLLDSAPHDAVMPCVSMVVTHGGHGTVSRALSHGLPLLVMPMGRDQNDIALRVKAQGVGLVLPSDAPEADIAAALIRLSTEPHFGIAARRLKDAMAIEIKSQRLVIEMEEIVRAARPRHTCQGG